jgi:signal transduction histidine kinase
MSLRTRTLLVLIATLGILIISLYLVSRLIILRGFDALEDAALTSDLQRVQNKITDQLDAMARNTTDWAHWDETYQFVADLNDVYIENNLTPESLESIDMSMMLFFDSDDALVHSVLMGDVIPAGTPMPRSLLAYFTPDSPVFARLEAGETAFGGLIAAAGKRILITAVPILPNEGRGEPRGTLVMGRVLTTERVGALSTLLALDMRIWPYDTSTELYSAPPPVELAAARDALSLSGQAAHIIHSNADLMLGYTMLRDINGEPAALARVEVVRDIRQQGEQSLYYLVMSLIAVGAVFTLIILYVFDRLILNRIHALDDHARRVKETGDLDLRITVPGSDEIANLGVTLNDMLARVKRTRQLEEEIAFKSRLLASVSHDARTPLSVILMRTEMLAMNALGPVSEAQKSALKSIQANANQLLRFVNNLLDAAQLEVGRLHVSVRPFQPYETAEAVQDSMEVLAEKRKIAFTLQSSLPPGFMVDGDRERVAQIMFNLADNALKFTDKGAVTLRLYQPSPTTWAFSVQDTGIGIPPEMTARLFDPYYQVEQSKGRAHGRGIGLGLAIVKELTDMLGGTIEIDSTVDVGTRFTLTFPVASTVRKTREMHAVQTQAAQSTQTDPAHTQPA